MRVKNFRLIELLSPVGGVRAEAAGAGDAPVAGAASDQPPPTDAHDAGTLISDFVMSFIFEMGHLKTDELSYPYSSRMPFKEWRKTKQQLS